MGRKSRRKREGATRRGATAAPGTPNPYASGSASMVAAWARGRAIRDQLEKRRQDYAAKRAALGLR